MNLRLTAEQQMLDDTVRRFASKADGPASAAAAHWSGLAGLGLLGLLVPPEQGGLALGAVETFVVMRALGSGGLQTPYVATALVGASLIQHAGSRAQHDRWLPAVVDGSLQIALATDDDDDRADPPGSAASASRRSRPSAAWA